MEHSIAARYAARPAARFPRPALGTTRRRLGLGVGGAFRPAPLIATVLRRSDVSPYTRLRGASRALSLAAPGRLRTGRPRPLVAMTWPRSIPVRRAPVAPWRG